jgi:hypothetical protein
VITIGLLCILIALLILYLAERWNRIELEAQNDELSDQLRDAQWEHEFWRDRYYQTIRAVQIPIVHGSYDDILSATQPAPASSEIAGSAAQAQTAPAPGPSSS